MTAVLCLTIATPAKLVVECDTVVSLQAADASGSFGILPGHTDLLTVVPASVVRWRDDRGTWHYCAVRAGVLEVIDGERVAIACREAVLSDDLAMLEAEVHKTRADQLDVDRQARVEQLRIHTLALRQIVRRLVPGARSASWPALDEGALE